jgi:hypothetical protein
VKNKVTRIIEQEVCEIYAKRFGEPVFLAVGNFKDYDGVSLSRQLTIEIKFEEKARETFNLALEVSSFGKPSGLTTTKAMKWVHVVPIDTQRMAVFEFETETLRSCTKDFPTYWGGDGRRSEMKLLPVNKASQIASRNFEFSIDWAAYQPYWE